MIWNVVTRVVGLVEADTAEQAQAKQDGLVYDLLEKAPLDLIDADRPPFVSDDQDISDPI